MNTVRPGQQERDQEEDRRPPGENRQARKQDQKAEKSPEKGLTTIKTA
jgi:hypothetical protein